jgi:ferredoxin-NADP reductase
VHERVKILNIRQETHNVRSYRVERPSGYSFEPGQATELSLDEAGYTDKRHPFTFTSLPGDDFLEFTIKSYFATGGDGMTERLFHYERGQYLILRDPWGTITYTGPGTFIGGGAGVTPFIAILRDLDRKGEMAGNRLIASHRKAEDIILRREFEAMSGLGCLWTVTDDKDAAGVGHDRIDEAFLKQHLPDFTGRFYLCGPDDMVSQLRTTLESLGARTESLTWEK